MKKEVVIITYYWPPSGGAGVQRWVKLSKYLSRSNVRCHIITVKEESSSYTQMDYSLVNDIEKDVHVYKTRSFEPNKLYGKIMGKDNIPTAGFLNAEPGLKQKMINAVRSNFFIPDPRRGWNAFAYKKACEVIKKHNIKTVITTSPPHSTQLVGKSLKKKFDVKWIADLRDPWTDIYYYDLLCHSRLSHRINQRYEKQVLEQADEVITVSRGMVANFKQKVDRQHWKKFRVIPNGFDPEDFKKIRSRKDKNVFNIVYTGTMSDQYEPRVLFQAMDAVQKETSQPIKLVIVGSISNKIRQDLVDRSFKTEIIPTVPHDEVTGFQSTAALLLLLIPVAKNDQLIVTGKLFEYLASKNRIINIGPENGEAASIITDCAAGETFDRDKLNEIISFLKEEINAYFRGSAISPDEKEIKHYSRKMQAEKFQKLIQ